MASSPLTQGWIADASAVAAVLTEATRRLAGSIDELNELNVFPVADGDTGTNMVATISAIAEAVESLTADEHVDIHRTVTRAGLRSARGNSGLILSQFLTGLFEPVADAHRSDADRLVAALTAAADRARGAVSHPVEGTMLTAADAAAAAARSALGPPDEPEGGGVIDASPAMVAAEASRASAAATEATPSQLAVLAEHGVVDAGAVGLSLVLAALADHLGGVDPSTDMVEQAAAASRPGGVTTGFEYTFVLDMSAPGADGRPRSDSIADDLRMWLRERGDDVVVGSGAGLVKAHVHLGTDVEANAALLGEAARAFGPLVDVRREALVEPVSHSADVLPVEGP